MLSLSLMLQKQVFIGVLTLHEKLDFSLRICSVNVANSVFGHI